jgi:hypothetical protein
MSIKLQCNLGGKVKVEGGVVKLAAEFLSACLHIPVKV